MELDLFSLATGFLIGTATGAAGKYYADKYTDQRRGQESTRAQSKRFRSIEQKMPKLLAEIRTDLQQSPDVRDFFVVPNKRVILSGSTTPAFQYYEDEHETLLGKIRTLENHGYVIDITPGNAPKFTMSEEFVDFVLASK